MKTETEINHSLEYHRARIKAVQGLIDDSFKHSDFDTATGLAFVRDRSIQIVQVLEWAMGIGARNNDWKGPFL